MTCASSKREIGPDGGRCAAGGSARGLPLAFAGMRIGLLGGSFDPPHAGHVHISLRALTAFRLHQVWWLVSPGNPLKRRRPAAPVRRIAAARLLIQHPRIIVTDVESRLQTRATADTLDRLLPLYPGVNFVWLMGSDNLASLHRWNRWQSVAERLPLGVLARPREQVRAGLSPAAIRYARARVPTWSAAALAGREPPAWCLLTGKMLGESSTALRARYDWYGIDPDEAHWG